MRNDREISDIFRVHKLTVKIFGKNRKDNNSKFSGKFALATGFGKFEKTFTF